MSWRYFEELVNYENIGVYVSEGILWVANLITLGFWPGLISLVLFSFFVIVLLVVSSKVLYRNSLLSNATKSVLNAGDAGGFQRNLGAITANLKQGRGNDAARLAEAFSEFRETLLEPSRDGESNVRNAFRPSTFINVDDLGYSLSAWRFVPGVFVSVGLLLTFLGLVAVLSSTQDLLPKGHVDQQQTISALRELLARASSKFTMSLTGLFCSILLTFALRLGSHKLEASADELANALEHRMDFISLEGLADRQLVAIKEQSDHMQRLNAELIAALSKPLQDVANSSVDTVGHMVKDLSGALTQGLGSSLEVMGERIDVAANSLSSLGETLSGAAVRFDESLNKSISALDGSIERLERVSVQLTSSAESVSSSVIPVMEVVKENNLSAQRIAEGSVLMVNSAKTVIEAERDVVVESTRTIEQMIRNFEGRAAAYDGQLEKAFKTYTEQVARTIAELETHGNGIHDKFAEALSTLQGVIENAKAFEPESASPHKNGNAEQ